MNKGKFYNIDNPYDDFCNLFKTITDKHALIKQRKVTGNNALFMTKNSENPPWIDHEFEINI